MGMEIKGLFPHQPQAKTPRYLTKSLVNYAGSAISIFEDLEILPTKGSVVASSDAQEVSMGSHFQYLLLDAMRNKRPFAKEEIKCYRNLFEYSRSGITRLMFVYEKLLIERREELNPERIHGTLILHIQHPQRSGLSLDHLLFPQ